jgi:hypothetical protein
MKAKEMAFVAVAVFFRTAAVLAALYGGFMMLTPLLMGGFGGSLILLRFLIVYLGTAVVLWLLSKPLAALIVSGLGDEPRP